MAKDCIICPYADIALGSERIICHHPLFPYARVIFPDDVCPNEKTEIDDIIEKAFLDNVCDVAECTGLSFPAFRRIALYFYNIGKTVPNLIMTNEGCLPSRDYKEKHFKIYDDNKRKGNETP